MITHIVLFKLKDPTAENIRITADVLRAMEGRIPELLEIEVGIDELRSERSYDVSLRTRHASWEDLDAYQKHPVHDQVLDHMKTVIARAVAVDFAG
ncbi:MAG: Dabb family protein, partial [Polyangiaceae bacterium]|nr:Dabb family protein [Polyangiaceae bacterium]